MNYLIEVLISIGLLAILLVYACVWTDVILTAPMLITDNPVKAAHLRQFIKRVLVMLVISLILFILIPQVGKLRDMTEPQTQCIEQVQTNDR